jgi:hypothetical protein
MEIEPETDDPCPIVMGAGASRANVGTYTPTGKVVVAFREPEVPVMVTVAEFGVAVLLAVSVSVVFPIAGFGVKDAVTPLGSPEMERLTLFSNP